MSVNPNDVSDEDSDIIDNFEEMFQKEESERNQYEVYSDDYQVD